MKKLLTLTLAFVVLSFILTPTAEAKILNKELVNKVTLVTGYKIQVCPVKIYSGEVISPSTVTPQTTYFDNPTQVSCTGDEQTLVYGDVRLDLKDGGEINEHILLYNDLILREDSLSFTYYEDGSVGGTFINGGGSPPTKKLKFVKTSTLHNTDPKLPGGQEDLSESGLVRHYDPSGQIDGMLFSIKGIVYKLTKTVSKAEEVTLVDYSQESPNVTPTPITDTSTWKTYENTKYFFSIKYPENKLSIDFENLENQALELKSPNYNPKEALEYFYYVAQVYTHDANNMNVPDWINKYIEDIKADRQYIKTEKILVAGVSGEKVSGLPDKENSLQIFLEHKGKIFELKFYPYNIDNVYSYQKEYNKIFEDMLSTFKFI